MTATVHEKGVDLESQPDDRLRAQALATTADELPEGYYTSPRVIASFAGFSLNVCTTYFVLQASASALPNILQDIGQSDNQSLFSTLWTMGQAVSILVMGRLTDRFGRRPFVIATHILGLVGAIVGCTANKFNTLLAAMTMLGVAAGPAGASSLFIGELMSNKHKFLGLLAVTVPSIVMTAGPYLGQRLSIQSSWRWIFYIYIIMSSKLPSSCIECMVMMLTCIQRSQLHLSLFGTTLRHLRNFMAKRLARGMNWQSSTG
ncbi:trichothecene efflux pump [Fusarium graminearum]